MTSILFIRRSYTPFREMYSQKSATHLKRELHPYFVLQPFQHIFHDDNLKDYK